MALYFDLDKKMDAFTHGDAKLREGFQRHLWALVPSFLDMCVSWLSTHMDDTTPEDLDLIVKTSTDLPGCVPSSQFSCHIIIKHRRRWLAFEAMRQVSKALQEVALKELPVIGQVIDMNVYTRWRCALFCSATGVAVSWSRPHVTCEQCIQAASVRILGSSKAQEVVCGAVTPVGTVMKYHHALSRVAAPPDAWGPRSRYCEVFHACDTTPALTQHGRVLKKPLAWDTSMNIAVVRSTEAEVAQYTARRSAAAPGFARSSGTSVASCAGASTSTAVAIPSKRSRDATPFVKEVRVDPLRGHEPPFNIGSVKASHLADMVVAEAAAWGARQGVLLPGEILEWDSATLAPAHGSLSVTLTSNRC